MQLSSPKNLVIHINFTDVSVTLMCRWRNWEWLATMACWAWYWWAWSTQT